MTATRISGLSAVPKVHCEKPGDVQYMCWGQNEKADMLAAGYRDVHTVHEFQGSEAKRVIMVRLQRAENGQTNASMPHIRVAASRHTQEFEYYYVDPVKPDKLATEIRALALIQSISAEHDNVTDGEGLKGEGLGHASSSTNPSTTS